MEIGIGGGHVGASDTVINQREGETKGVGRRGTRGEGEGEGEGGEEGRMSADLNCDPRISVRNMHKEKLPWSEQRVTGKDRKQTFLQLTQVDKCLLAHRLQQKI